MRPRDALLQRIDRLRAHLLAAHAPGALLADLADVEIELLRLTTSLGALPAPEAAEDPLPSAAAELVEAQELRLDGSDPAHMLIEGENLTALGAIAATSAGSVDVVLIDPPYNSDVATLPYRDAWRPSEPTADPHAEWVRFIGLRLLRARPLLTATGVVYIHIDEHEIAPLIGLAARVFGDDNVDVLVWPKLDPAFDQNRVERKTFGSVRIVHEYVVVCYRDKARSVFNPIRQPTPRSRVGSPPPGELTQMESILDGLGTTASAKDELAELCGRRDAFPTPKPVRLAMELVRAAAGAEATVLDFFAGSGTTGHAVMALNAEDGGRRRFILVTNDEGRVCREVAYERLRRARDRTGCTHGIRYFRALLRPRQPVT